MIKNIQTSTMKVQKSVLEDIKIYCKKHGKPVGEWVDIAWNFIKKNDFDIYDEEATPALPVPEEIAHQEGQVEGLCMLMKEFITTQQKALLPPSDYIELRENKARLEERIKNLEEELEDLKKYKERAHGELERIRKEQPYLGRIEVRDDL